MDGIFLNRRGTGRFWEDIVKSDYYVKKVLAEEIGLAITGQTQANQTGYVKHEDSGGHFTSGATTVLGEIQNLDNRLYKWTNQTDTVVGDKTISGNTETIVGITTVNISGGTVNISGNTSLGGSCNDTLTINSTTTINCNETVNGNVTITGNTTNNGTLTMGSDINLSENKIRGFADNEQVFSATENLNGVITERIINIGERKNYLVDIGTGATKKSYVQTNGHLVAVPAGFFLNYSNVGDNTLYVVGSAYIDGNMEILGNTTLGNQYNDIVRICGTTNANGNVNITGSTKITSNLTVNGNTTIGDSTGDTLTLNAGTTAANGTKFDALKIVDAGDTSSNVRESWKLVDKAGNQYGNTIKIYKDGSLADVSLVDLHEQPSDWPSGQTYKDGQYLRFDYEVSEGGHDIVYVDVSLMLVESEFASGVTATSAGIVRGVVDPNSQKDTNNNHYLTVGANGFKISGINEAINKAITGVTSGLTVVDSPVDKQFVTAVSEEDGIITVSRKQPTFTDISGKTTPAQHYDVTGAGITSATSKWVNSVSVDTKGHVTGVTSTRPTFSDISGRTTDAQHHEVSSTGADAETGKWVKSIAVDQYGHITGTTTTQPSFDDIDGNIPVTKLPTGSTTQYGIVKVTNGNGLSIDGGVISMASATTADAGAVTTGAQTFAGDKTFNNNLTVKGNTQLGDATGDTLTICGNTTANGGISATTGFWQTSDERMKLFIDEVNGDLEKIKQIPTKRFYWRTQPDGPLNIGTSAQKIKDLYPEIVSGDETLSVDYSKFGIIAIAAIKELTAKVEYLEERLKQLEKN